MSGAPGSLVGNVMAHDRDRRYPYGVPERGCACHRPHS